MLVAAEEVASEEELVAPPPHALRISVPARVAATSTEPLYSEVRIRSVVSLQSVADRRLLLEVPAVRVTALALPYSPLLYGRSKNPSLSCETPRAHPIEPSTLTLYFMIVCQRKRS